MEFKIRSCSSEDFLKSLREIERNTRPFNVEIFKAGKNEKNNLSWAKLDWNVQSNGKKIFALKLKPKDAIVKAGDPAFRIQDGNYYIEFYYYRKNGKEQNVVGCVDLYIDGFGNVTRPGYHPLFLFKRTFENFVKHNQNELMTYDIKEILRMSIKDRLKQICAKKGSIPDPSLLAESINYAFKFSELNCGNKFNFGVKIANRVVYINTSNNENGSWAFDWAQNSKGNFSDCLNTTESIDIEALEEMIKCLEDKDNKSGGSGIVLGEASEEGGRKGNLVVLNKELQKLRHPGKKIYKANYEDILYGESPIVPGSVYTIYDKIAKFFARVKGFITSDGCLAHDLEAKKKSIDGEEIYFDRHKCYLSNKSNNIGRIGENTRNIINMLAVYVPADSEDADISLKEFEDCDKTKYSEMLHGADCHIDISSEASEMLVRVKRVISEPITEKHLSIAFQDAMKEVKLGEVVEYDTSIPIGYKVLCELDDCNSIMTPVKATGRISEGTLEVEEIQADRSVNEWFCDICGHFVRKEPQPILIADKYQSAKFVSIHSVTIDKADIGININVEIISPTGIARIISVEGVKGLTSPINQDFIGYINGQIYNPDTGKHEDLMNIPADLMMNLGSMKGKISGVGISHVRMINAFTGSKICPDEIYRKDKNLNKVNEILEHCPKVQLTRRKFDIQRNGFVWATQEVYAGIISIDVTEIGDEFLKVKTDQDDMKVSHMNTLFYDWLGFNDLNNAMAKSSFEDMENASNYEFANELFKMFYSDPEGLPEVKHVVELDGERWDKSKSDFNNPEGSIDIVSWLEKSEWVQGLEHHPLLKQDSKFVNGAYFVDKQNNIIVFPSRKTIMKMVDVMNGNRIRLNGIVKDALGMFLDIYTKGWTPKVKSYKDNIFKKLTGKQGIAARAATFVNYGATGKELGSGYIPPGVVVIGNKNFWKMVRKHCDKLGTTWQDINEGRFKLLGTSQRDPFIWIFQALNAVELWTVKRADNYFKQRYVTFTVDEQGNEIQKPMKFTDIYSNFNGIMLNILDMLYLFQTDADGDLRRVLTSFDMAAQIELNKMNKIMLNYDFICKSDSNSEVGKLYQRVKSWHLDYVKDEAKSAAYNIKGPLKITVMEFNTSARNAMIIKNIKAKGNIGIITTSQWKIQKLVDYLVHKGEQLVIRDDLPPMALTISDRNAICVFYQTVFTQDGCVRALKATKDLGLCSLDETANNGPAKWQDPDTLEWIEGSVRDMIRDEAKKNGYADIVDKFFAVCDYWKDIAGISTREDQSVGPKLDQMSEEAEMINAYVSLCNGSKYIAIDRHSMFERLVAPESRYVAQKKSVEPLVPYLEKIAKRNSEKKEDK